MEERRLEVRDLQPRGDFKEEHDSEAGPEQCVELPQVGFRHAGQRGHKPLVPVRRPNDRRIGGFQPLAIF